MDNQRRTTLTQALMDATRRDQYKQCLVKNGCPGPAVKGHSVPRAYLRRLPGHGGQMMVFNRPRFGDLPRETPMREGISEASTGYFTCQEHEELFGPADGIIDLREMPDLRTLNLVCYRSLLHSRWWWELWAQSAERVDAEHNTPIQRGIGPVCRKRSSELLPAQTRLERCVLNPEHEQCLSGQCGSFEHIVFVSEGTPVVAAAAFGIQEYYPTQFGTWGMTLIPGTDSNAMILHFPPEVGTRAMEVAFPSLSTGKAELTGRAVSAALLKFCFDVIFSEESWSSLNDYEQETVRRALAPWEKNPPFDVDLFKGSPWKLL